MSEQSVFLGKGAMPRPQMLKRAKRHILIAGATGTGKTVLPQIPAEGFSAYGGPGLHGQRHGLPMKTDCCCWI